MANSAPLIAWFDIESNGLWPPQRGMGVMTLAYCLYVELSDGRIFDCSDITPGVARPGYASMRAGLEALMAADIRVAHNGQGFDDRALAHFFPYYVPKAGSKLIDTLLVSRLVYPMISQQGPNTHLVPGQMKTRHSVAAWGYRLRENKGDYTDWCKEQGIDPWTSGWRKEMQDYMVQDVKVLKKIFFFLMAQKPTPLSIDIEHGFAAIMRRQEVWGFTFNHAKALALNAIVQERKRKLEADLIEHFGSWWEGKEPKRITATRRVKVLGHPDVTMARYNKDGKRLAKDYVGPPLCTYEEGAWFTPVEYIQFQPGSRAHVHKMLVQRYGWKPVKLTAKKAVAVDDEVLRALPYPEAPQLADYYAAVKIDGYLNSGAQAWLSVVYEEEVSGQPGVIEFRMHGQVITIGTYTHRASHMKPNKGQIPTRDPEYGHKCRELFTARPGFKLAGFDGSGMQLRLLAHYLYNWDNGLYASVFEKGIDPHGFMQDTIGTDLMGEGAPGRDKGKTTNYALVFGGGEPKLGSIIEPTASLSRKKELGALVKERMAGAFGTAFDDLKLALKVQVEKKGYVTGLDGRRCYILKPHAALAALLQMGEAVVMKQALILHDDCLQALGLKPGVSPSGVANPRVADYEFCANVHDEAQADVRPEALALYEESALWCVAEAGRRLSVKCPLKSDVKVGDDWSMTH